MCRRNQVHHALSSLLVLSSMIQVSVDLLQPQCCCSGYHGVCWSQQWPEWQRYTAEHGDDCSAVRKYHGTVEMLHGCVCTCIYHDRTCTYCALFRSQVIIQMQERIIGYMAVTLKKVYKKEDSSQVWEINAQCQNVIASHTVHFWGKAKEDVSGKV